jgi:hypothetical protein
MDLAAIERALAASEARPILADARLVRRVIKRDRHLPGIGLQVPHARCYALRREALLAAVDPRALGRAAADLPEECILLPRPERDELRRKPPLEILADLWRCAFHAQVHLEIDRLVASGVLTPARLRERIHRIGQTEFDEIRLVLQQDRLLLPPGDDHEAYAEFAALYLELQSFAPGALEEVFPTLDEDPGVAAALAEDIDTARLLAATRPDGAADLPKPRAYGEVREEAAEKSEVDEAVPAPEPGADVQGLLAAASKARAEGNNVRSALLRLRAGDAGEARADAEALAQRIDRAVRPEGEEGGKGLDTAAWTKMIFGLLRRAEAPGDLFRRVEARLLYDVQSACLAGEKPIGKVDLVEWALALGRRPLARLLPSTREVRVGAKLKRAALKVPRLGVAEAERARLRELLDAARRRADETLREELRPLVRSALLDVGLRPEEGNVPERVALAKIVEELLDQATAHGHLSLGQLRDAVSRNQLKLHDLSGARELAGADALLAADRRMARVIDGVHRRGEIYLRALQKGSSLLFGTRSGRSLVLYVLLPVGGGFLLPFALPLIINEFSELARAIPHLIEDLGRLLHVLPPKPPEIAAPHHHHHLDLPPLEWVIACSALLFGLIHSAPVRAAALQGLRAVGFVLAAIFVHIPRWVLSRPIVQRVLRSRPVVALWRFGVKPGVVAGAVSYGMTLHREPPAVALPIAGAVFVVVGVALNSRLGIDAEEIALDALARTFRKLQQQVLPGLFRLVAGFFRRITDALDRGIYTVDEWLRFRKGQSRAALVVKAVLGVFWFAVAYLLRILVNLFIEPTINPLKHFPTVTVAAKVMWATVGPPLHAALVPILGSLRAGTLTGLAMGLLPGFFGFLVWELKENFKLYRAARPATLRPVPIGHHGETMGALLKPGLHSGTLPKLWAKLRRAARKSEGAVEKHREAMRELEEAVEHFVDRELSALLGESARWEGGAVHVARVALASNQVRVDLARAGRAEPCTLAFEEQSGWLCAGLARPGWVNVLEGDERVLFENALAGLYQRAGVDMVREQLAAALPAEMPYDIADEGLVVWPAGFTTEWVYPLDGEATLTATVRGEPAAEAPPTIERAAIVFRAQEIAWAEWVAAFGPEPRRVVKGASLLG